MIASSEPDSRWRPYSRAAGDGVPSPLVATHEERWNERFRRKSSNEASYKPRRNGNENKHLVRVGGVVRPGEQTQSPRSAAFGRGRDIRRSPWQFGMKHERRHRRAERAKARERSHGSAGCKEFSLNHLRSIPRENLAASEPKIKANPVIPPEARGGRRPLISAHGGVRGGASLPPRSQKQTYPPFPHFRCGRVRAWRGRNRRRGPFPSGT